MDLNSDVDVPFRICVISFPMPSTIVVNVFLCNFIKILNPICRHLYIITSSLPKDSSFSGKLTICDLNISMHRLSDIKPHLWSLLLQVLKIIFIQIKICYSLVSISSNVDIIIFYIGGSNLILPVLMAKILKKKVITFAIGSGSFSYKNSGKGWFRYRFLGFFFQLLERIIFHNSDYIISESANVANFLHLNSYNQKIIPLGARYVDKSLFYSMKPLKDRKDLIGYIGRFDGGKGVNDLIEAIPLIMEERNDIKFILIGDGPLFGKIKNQVKNHVISQKVELIGWVDHKRVADFLNELTLLILPSYSEGLPTIVLEAMACGTPVLVTPVGGIPDVVRDEKTGFILRTNSPQCIAKNVIRALEHPSLEQIATNAKTLVEEQYSYENAVGRYRAILKTAYFSK